MKDWLRDIIKRTGAEAAARIIEANLSIDLRPQLHQIDLPTLIIHGVLDTISPSALQDAKTFAEMIPQAKLTLLDAGH